MKLDWLFKPIKLRPTNTPYCVLVAMMLLTAVATYYVAVTAKAKDRLRFEGAVDSTQNDIKNRLDTYISLLRTGSGLFAAAKKVSRNDFQAFVDRLNLEENYRGIQGIGFTARILAPEKDAFVAQMRQEGLKDFNIRPGFQRAEYNLIIYLEPLDRRNKVAIGYDMFTDPVRREAMQRARDKDEPAASGKVTLVQEIDQNKQAGFLIYVPVYRQGTKPKTVAERRAALQGFVYSPFRSDDLLEGVFGGEKFPYVNFKIYDGIEISPHNLLYSSESDQTADHPLDKPSFTTKKVLNIAGRIWTIVFVSEPELERVSETRLVPYILLFGLLFAFLLFSLMRSQVRARAAAERSQQALTESEERFQAFMNYSPTAAWITDQNGQIIYHNKTYCNLFNLPSQDLVGKTGFDIYPLEFANIYLENIRIVAETKQVVEVIEQVPVADGKINNFLVYKFPIFDASGRCLVGGVAIDITERKRAEEEREELLAREQIARNSAEAANRIKDEFLATLSHELRTPLNAMVGWTSLLRTRKFDEATTARALETIDRNTKSLSQLIEDLLDVSRIMNGKFRIEMRPVNLALVIDAAIEAVRAPAEAKNIQINSLFEHKIMLVSGDSTRLQQIIWNLMSNAIKFTPKGGQVDVRVTRDNSNAKIIISDNGQGISPEFLPYIFERFRQADASITRSHGGLGLGLAIVRHLVELHGGRIWAESEGEGQGSKFMITLPLRAIRDDVAGVEEAVLAIKDRDISKEDSPPKSPGILNGLSVLIVDDEPDTRDLVTMVLAESGAKVTAVGSAKEAFEIIVGYTGEKRPDILISDIGMPEEDGYSLIRKIRKLPAAQGGQIPAAALTAYARVQERKKVLEAGFQIHIPKPVDPVELVRMMASFAGRN